MHSCCVDCSGRRRRRTIADGCCSTALLFAVAFRVPLAVGWVGPRSDMVRYRWDGRVQTLGYNPYLVMPDDPAVAWTHTDETRLMPSIHDRTPYPAAAQLFFRVIVSIADSSLLMKIAAGRVRSADHRGAAGRGFATPADRRGSSLVYAWNPLVILEVAHSGHIDALGSLWIAVSAWMLSTNRGMRAIARVRDCCRGEAAADRPASALLEARKGT